MKMKKVLENQGLFLAEKERFEGLRPHSRRIVALCRSIHSLLGLLALAPSLLCSPLVEIVVSFPAGHDTPFLLPSRTRFFSHCERSRSMPLPVPVARVQILLQQKKTPDGVFFFWRRRSKLCYVHNSHSLFDEEHCIIFFDSCQANERTF